MEKKQSCKVIKSNKLTPKMKVINIPIMRIEKFSLLREKGTIKKRGSMQRKDKTRLYNDSYCKKCNVNFFIIRFKEYMRI